MVSAFLSHWSKDKPFVRELADFLRADGEIQVWLDERGIAPGQNIVDCIGDGLPERCRIILFGDKLTR